ncbi:MAG: diguanylate cyclase domain-containing protein [Lachnospiraceae bacterium]
MFYNRTIKSSLRKRILFSSVSALLILALVMGTVCVYVVGTLSKDDSQKIMSQFCDKESLQFDNKLHLVYNAVEILYKYAKELQNTNDGMEVYSVEDEQRLKAFSFAVANETDGAVAVYFRYNPEITGKGIDGFFLTKNMETGYFEEEMPTDILAYNSSDIEHVGWFYIPKETGEPLWMSPYYNNNLDVFMISYIIPLYLNSGEFLGVIGMDIDFKLILNEIQDVQIYESESIACVDLKEGLIYYSDSDGEVRSENLSNELYHRITTIDNSSELLEITDMEGNASVICCRKLSNGMIMYINVPKSEIYHNRNYLIMICILITIFIFSISSIVIWKHTKKMLYPLEKISEVTDKYAEGDWSIQYISYTGDEFEKLSEGIARMARNTQDYIEKLNHMARTDAATGIGNKTSYLELVSDIINNKFNRYAVVAMDLNYLKRTNDTYGHETGDILLKEAAKYISRIFKNSQVFRTGGDEFVAILFANDYRNRKELIKEFEEKMRYPIPEADDLVLSISYGMAEAPGEHTDYDKVFELADERMYRKKKEMRMETV